MVLRFNEDYTVVLGDDYYSNNYLTAQMELPASFSVNDYISYLLTYDVAEKEEYVEYLSCMQSPEFANIVWPEVEEEIKYDNLELLATIVMAEAGNQGEMGIRLVIDVILNRVDSERFPNTVWDVIYAPDQFTCVLDGNAASCYVRDDILALIHDEINQRTNNEVLYFRTKHFHTFGTPLFQWGDHYFSK